MWARAAPNSAAEAGTTWSLIWRRPQILLLPHLKICWNCFCTPLWRLAPQVSDTLVPNLYVRNQKPPT